MKCVKCSKEISENAKFCGACGAPQPVSSEEKHCPNCNFLVAPNAKFCGKCGTQLITLTEQPQVKQSSVEQQDFKIVTTNNYINWKILPGQLAVKIDEQEIASYSRIKGVYVAPGTVALFYVNGKCVATLASGSYAFDDYTNEEITESKHKSNAVIS